MNGLIFDLKRFAVHDGGGIRSTAFLKGCPLHCPWCQNPEGRHAALRLWHRAGLCIACGGCVRACPRGALSLAAGKIILDQARCNACGGCIDPCPAGAMELDGREVSAAEVAAGLLRDRVFFGTEGGVTLSGGEVLAQPEFAAEILRLCKKEGADTAIETCLFAPQEVVAAFLPLTDHFIVDLKYRDSATHLAVLGGKNEIILENYEFLVQSGGDVLVRTPLIPGYTATEENLAAIAAYVHGVDPRARMELLNFNPLCRSKYAARGQDYPVAGGAFSDADMARFSQIVREAGVTNLVEE